MINTNYDIRGEAIIIDVANNFIAKYADFPFDDPVYENKSFLFIVYWPSGFIGTYKGNATVLRHFYIWEAIYNKAKRFPCKG